MADDDKKENGSACGCGGGSCCGGPGKWIWLVLAVAVVGVLTAKNAGKRDVPMSTPAGNVAPAAAGAVGMRGIPEAASQGKALPRLVDLGGTKCIPCKMMAPILEDLKKTYAGKMDVVFIDATEKPDEAKKYGMKIIPTQIFCDAAGKELFRHEGFIAREDILAKWKELGVELTPAETNTLTVGKEAGT